MNTHSEIIGNTTIQVSLISYLYSHTSYISTLQIHLKVCILQVRQNCMSDYILIVIVWTFIKQLLGWTEDATKLTKVVEAFQQKTMKHVFKNIKLKSGHYLLISEMFFFARFIFILLALRVLLNRLLLRLLFINMLLHGHCTIILLVTSNCIP